MPKGAGPNESRGRSPSTPAGIKGMAEGGTMGGIGRLMKAALARAGAGFDSLPATPQRIWQALRAAERKGR